MSKQQWSKLTQEKRTAIMRERGKQRMAKMTKEERSELARKASLARWKLSPDIKL